MENRPKVADSSISPIMAMESPQTNGTLSPCNTCKKTFTSSLYLERHQRSCYIKDGPRLMVERDTARTDMNSPGRVCSDTTVYYCPYCTYYSTHRGHIRQHLLSHTGEKTCKCDVCGKGFAMAGHLTRHKYIHTKDKPYQCTECPYSSSTKYNFKNHMLAKHTNEKIYACSECSFRAVHRTNMTKHTRIHTREKPYHCHHCDYRASLKHHMTKHIARKHNSIMKAKK